MKRISVVSLAVLALAACAGAPEPVSADGYVPAFRDPALRPFTVDRFETFADEAAFMQYVRDVREISMERNPRWTRKTPPVWDIIYTILGGGQNYYNFAPGLSYGGEPPSADMASPVSSIAAESEGEVVITASSIPADGSTITNVQKAGVDEGDIVKRIGRHLVVLQDGRLFSVDLGTGDAPELRLSARTNVYASPEDDDWFDEMLVFGERVLVTSYSYEHNGTKLSVFRMDPATGAFTGEGAFVISSNDYYSADNYATRMVGDKLVVHTPVYLADVNPERPMDWPLVRRWQKDAPGPEKDGTRLFDASAIYRPMQPSLEPVIHTVSVCDLGASLDGAAPPCRATAITAPGSYVFYVSSTDAYLWAESSDDPSRDMCHAGPELAFEDGVPAGLYRIPLSGKTPQVMWTRGSPLNQFSIDTSGDHVRALTMWGRTGCDYDGRGDDSALKLKYFSAPMAMFRDRPQTPSASHYQTVPDPESSAFENRFTDTHVVYGSREDRSYFAPEDSEMPIEGKLVAVPVVAPDKATTLSAPHGIVRAERVGNDMVLTGYRNGEGLSLSYLDLSGEAKIVSTTLLKSRYESERRSHAFNSRVSADGSGVVSLPTVVRTEESGRWVWRSDASDLSYVTFDADGRLAPAGEIAAREDSEDPAYTCEVSCIDWYGNSRPFFIGNRVFALMGAELVEAKLEAGRVIELRRVNLTGKVG